MDGLTRSRALAIFNADGEEHQVEEKRPSRFRLCVRFMSRSASFRMAALLVQDTKEKADIGRFGGCSDTVAARYARIACVVSLEHLSKLISSVWAFSLALDYATHQNKSYVDIRCRFSSKGKLHNFHLLAIPLFERRTVGNIFTVVQRMLNALLPTWWSQLIGVATDGATTMVECVGGLVTLMEAEATHNIT